MATAPPWAPAPSATSSTPVIVESLNLSANASVRPAWLEPEIERDNLLIIMPLSVLYVVIFVFGVLGNISTCVVIGRNRQMRTATNYYLFSLACSDLLLLISGLPLELHKIWFPYPYPFNEPVCIIQGLAAETSANATVLTILLFTCERYIAIVHPLAKHQARRRGGRLLHRVAKAPCLLAGIWVLALCLAVPQAMQFGVMDPNEGLPGAPDLSECTIKRVVVEHAFLVSTVVFFLGPVSVITLLYVRIAVKLHQVKRHRIRCTNQNQGQGHVFRILVAVVVTFFMCWAPFHAQRLVAVYMTRGDTPEEEERFKVMFNVITYISGVLYFMSTMINPILYHSMSNKFKEAFWDTIYRDFHGFNCITIPEHWKKKQESRYNVRRGQQEWTRRNGSASVTGGPPTRNRGASGSMFEVGTTAPQLSMFELLPLNSATTNAIVSTEPQPLSPSTKIQVCATAVVDSSKLHVNGLCLNGLTSSSGVSLPPLLRSQSMYAAAATSPASRPPPPRRSCTVDAVTPPAEGPVDSPADWGTPGRCPTASRRRPAWRTVLPDASALDAIVPCPTTPTPPASAPTSPARPQPSSPASPPSYRAPRVVEMYLKNEAVPEPGWV